MQRLTTYLWFFLVSGICYGKTVTFKWLNWDDDWLVLSNKIIHVLSIDNLLRLCSDFSLATRLQLGAEFLPLRDLSFMLQWQIFGDWAGGFHLFNLLLFSSSLLLLYEVLSRQSHRPHVAFMATLLFAAHPIHVEPVSWISGHRDILSFFFFMLAAFALEQFLAKNQRRWALLVAAAFLCSILSKYAAIVFPAYAVMRYLFSRYFATVTSKINPRWQVLWLFTPLLAISALQIYFIFKVSALVGMIGTPLADSPLTTFVTMLNVLRLYIGKLFLPLHLSPKYQIEIVSITSMLGLVNIFFALSLLASAILLALMSRKEIGDTRLIPNPNSVSVVCPRFPKYSPIYLFWGAWFFVALIPVSQLFAIQNKMADRYLLLSSIAFAMIVALGIEQLSDHLSRQKVAARRMINIFFYTLVLAYGAHTFISVDNWRDSISLWSHTARIDPNNQVALYQLSQAFKAEGNLHGERQTLKNLLIINPQHEQAINNYAINLAQKPGTNRKVIELYESLLRINPSNTKALHNYAQVLLREGRQSEAIEALQRLISLDPSYCKALTTLANIHQENGAREVADKLLKRAEKCYHSEQK